ncbi:MAG: sensor histidine kinase [Nitrososphaerales archaeon]
MSQSIPVAPDSTTIDQERTIVVKGRKQVETLAYEFFERSTASFLYALSDGRLPADPAATIDYTRGLLKRNPNYKIRLITDIRRENLDYYKQVIALGTEIRHLQGNRVSFAITKDEYISTPIVSLEEQILAGERIPQEIVWSTKKDLVTEFNQIFQVMWNSAIPADLKIAELEQGVEYERIEVMDDPKKIQQRFVLLCNEAQHEILLMLPTVNAFHREKIIGVIDILERKASESVRVRVLTPIDQEISKRIEERNWRSSKHFDPEDRSDQSISVREIDSAETDARATILVIDRTRCLVIEQKSDSELDFSKAIGLATYSNSKPTVSSYVAFFGKLWRETDLKQREERNRRQSELLQDILTHDIRNYNQVSRMGAEVLIGHFKEDSEFQEIASTVIEAIDGSSKLVEKAQKLGKIITQGRTKLQPTDLINSIDKSLLLAKGMYPRKKVRETRRVVSKSSKITVAADDLLDEVFINLFSNAIKFNPSDTLSIDILIEEYNPSNGEHFWKVTVGDHGPGIASPDLTSVFERYSKGKRGSGLGLSIVHALVVGRYNGEIKVENRKQPDSGAVFEILLRRS